MWGRVCVPTLALVAVVATTFTGASANVTRTMPVANSEASEVDYDGATWNGAHKDNYTKSERPNSEKIDRVIIHVTEGSYSSTKNWFKNPKSKVTSHYVVRSSDGDVTQAVNESDIAWHAGNWEMNERSVGIEHEGWVDEPKKWFTEEMYESSAALARSICDRYGIPRDRDHILGHSEVPGADHTDPGSGWDWDHYMDLVRGEDATSDADGEARGDDAAEDAQDEGAQDKDTDGGDPAGEPADEEDSETPDDGGLADGEPVVIDDDAAEASQQWSDATAEEQQGDGYHEAASTKRSDPLWYDSPRPSGGKYRVEVRYPAADDHSEQTPYLVSTSDGVEAEYIDQTARGGEWQSLGDFELDAGDDPAVGVSRWTSNGDKVAADSIRMTKID